LIRLAEAGAQRLFDQFLGGGTSFVHEDCRCAPHRSTLHEQASLPLDPSASVLGAAPVSGATRVRRTAQSFVHVSRSARNQISQPKLDEADEEMRALLPATPPDAEAA
jgi:hypothetical protein